MLLLGAARMFDLQNWGIALLASVVAVLPLAVGFLISLPLAVGFLISLPFGIWALIVISRRDVMTAFADWRPEHERKQMMKTSLSWVGGTMVAGMLVGLTLGAALDQDNIGLYMVLGMVLGMLIGTAIDTNHRREPKD